MRSRHDTIVRKKNTFVKLVLEPCFSLYFSPIGKER